MQADDPDAPEPDRTILLGAGMASGITMPIPSEGRLWGEMWVSRSAARPAYTPSDLPFASEVAALIGEVIASGELLERTARMAFEDPLTRLANRRVFDDRLAELLEPGQPGATVVLCDLDDLKSINDEAGHEAGDRVIILAADALSVVASRVNGCVAARIGGDEFALVLPGDVREQAVTVAQRAAALLRRGPQGATMSCGVAAAPAGTPAAQPGGHRRCRAVRREAPRGPARCCRPTSRRPSTRCCARDPRGRCRARRRRWDDATDRPYAADAAAAVAEAMQALAEGLSEAPLDAPGALRWIGDTLLGPLDLDRWVLSTVRDGPQGEQFALDSLGMRRARLDDEPPPEEAEIAGEVRLVDDFPGARAAMDEGYVLRLRPRAGRHRHVGRAHHRAVAAHGNAPDRRHRRAPGRPGLAADRVQHDRPRAGHRGPRGHGRGAGRGDPKG